MPTTEELLQLERIKALAGLEQQKIDAEKALKQSAIQARSTNLRIAQDVLLENQRSKPFSERNVSVEDIVAFATTLDNYVTSGNSTEISTQPTL